MDKTTISVTDFFLENSENVRTERLHKMLSGYLSSRNTESEFDRSIPNSVAGGKQA